MIMLHPTRLAVVALTDHGGPNCSTNGPIHQIIALDQDNTFFCFIYCMCKALKLFFILMLYQLDMARNCFFDHLLHECPLPFASCLPSLSYVLNATQSASSSFLRLILDELISPDCDPSSQIGRRADPTPSPPFMPVATVGWLVARSHMKWRRREASKQAIA